MLKPSLLFSGSALLGLLSLPFLIGECGWLTSSRKSQSPVTEVSLQAWEHSLPSSQALFEDEAGSGSWLMRQAQLQERVQQLEQRSLAHQQQVYQWLAQQAAPQPAGGVGRSSSSPALSARPRRQDPTLSPFSAQADVPNELALLTQFIQQEPGNAQLYLQRAQYFWRQSQEDPAALPQPEHASAIARLMRSALRDLDIAIALDPYLAEAYLLKAKIQHERLQEPEQALATLSPLDRIAYHNPQLHLIRSRIWAEQGHLESAFDVSHLAIELAKQNQSAADLFEAYVHRGLMWASICDFNLAVQDFSRAIEVQPQRAEGYYHRGMARAYQGEDRAGAASDLGSALMLWRASGTGSPGLLEYVEAVRRELLR